MSHDSSNEGLKRVIGVPGLTATVINFSIGAGIYALPALIGLQLGTASILGYILCGIMFAAIMFCYVEIGSRVKTSGGSYAYVENAFGPFAGFIVNWLFFFGWSILSDAAVMNIVADSLAVLFPIFNGGLMRALLFAVLIGLMIFVNVRDTKKSVRFVELVTVIKLLPLLAIILFGFAHIQMNNLRMEYFPSLKAFNDTALILFFALAGFESSLSVSGEIKDPKRTVPRGILLGGILVFSIYILIQIITQGVLGAEMSAYKDTPLAGIANKIAGTTGVTIVLFAAALSGLGAVNGDVLASPRLLFAGAKDGLFPKYLGKVHPKFATPHLAVITFAVSIFIFAVSGGFKQLAVMASGSLLLIYLAVVLATIKLRSRKAEQGAEKSFKAPGGLIIPGIAITAILYVLSNLSRMELFSIAVFVGIVCLIYWVMKRFNATRN
ncbi:MAG TPA: amino acid permease [Bacteroidia bacterium]|nr:amino acid permease [Bacteroidia bacterium]